MSHRELKRFEREGAQQLEHLARADRESYRVMSQHRCIVAANEALAAKNTRLTQAMEIPSGKLRLVVATEVIQKKRGARPTLAMVNYCPFCGEKLEAT